MGFGAVPIVRRDAPPDLMEAGFVRHGFSRLRIAILCFLLLWLDSPAVDGFTANPCMGACYRFVVVFPRYVIRIMGQTGTWKKNFVSTGFGAQLFEGHQLVTSGPFAIVRNPMYFRFHRGCFWRAVDLLQVDDFDFRLSRPVDLSSRAPRRSSTFHRVRRAMDSILQTSPSVLSVVQAIKIKKESPCPKKFPKLWMVFRKHC
jgi:hypothetical protein